jgi:ATP-dependent RNA helicase DDX10/DBP4
MLVLDEADRILDLGFSQQLNSILSYLPSDGRQTLLFSATQTKSIKDLARLSLSSPEYVGTCPKREGLHTLRGQLIKKEGMSVLHARLAPYTSPFMI